MGKTNTSTQQTTIPADVLARYNDVNNQAQTAASRPFQTYSSDPNAFVAPLTTTQQQGISDTTHYANAAQPYFGQATNTLNQAQDEATGLYGQAGQTIGGLGAALGAASPYNTGATGLALAGAQAVDPSNLDAAAIQKYISPYLSTVLGSTSALLDQNNRQQQSGALGSAISSGAFGGDRAGIAAANLEQQQNLANANIYSNIANSAYTNALSTAEGQQSLGFAAAQANRAALQNASGQMLGIGNQIYNQGTGTEQLQYGQQTGLAGAEYGAGAATSAALANLGAGAQSAGLQGAQAELAAGQQEQQTQQAGKTALYNQFLQQQSYPFQVAQFLANVAEGTGSLSGQTTTTTQPGSLFSDKRLKERAKVVGFTFDGQPIYSFRYKGDHTTHMGLMAQDVEKDHPEAVGEAGGFKTVDYAKATDRAAEKGHYKRGGLVPYRGYAYGGAPGFDPTLAEAMLQNERGMFGPYTAAGPGVASPGQGPYGGQARVPAANLPVGGLHIPQQSAIHQASAASQANSAAKDWSDLAANIGKGADWVKSKMGSRGNDNDIDGEDWSDGPPLDIGMRRGGRARFADGGLPYEGGLALNIPDDEQAYHLPQQPPPPKPGASTAGDAKDIADTAADVAKVAAMFMNRGGFAQARHRYADGGGPDDEENDDSGWGALAPLAHILKGGVGAATDAIGNAATHPFDTLQKAGEAEASQTGADVSTPPPRAPGLIDPQKAKSAAEYRSAILHNAAQSAQTPEEYAAVVKAASSGPGDHADFSPSRPRRSGLGAANDPWPNGPPLNIGGDRPITPAPSEAGPSIAAPSPASLDLTTDRPDLTPAGGLTAPSSGPGVVSHGLGALKDIGAKIDPEGGYLDKLMHGDRMTLLPFLAGLGAMTAAPTSNFGTALAQGLAAGAKTYQTLRIQEPEIEQAQARVPLIAAETARQGVGAYEDLQRSAPAGYQLVEGTGPNGQSFMVNGKPYHYALQTAVTDFGGGSGAPGTGVTAKVAFPHVNPTQAPSNDTDAAMAQHYNIDTSQPGAANHTRMLGLNPALKPVEDAAAKSAQERIGNQAEADGTHRQLLQSAEALSQLSKGSLTGQGYNSAYRAQLANIYQTATGMMGVPPDPAVTADLTAHQITEKIRQLSGAQMAHQYGERAASIAHSIANVLPSGDLTPEAASHILSQMLVANQQQRDFAQYYNSYAARYGTPIDVEPAFQRDTGNVYDVEQRNLNKVLNGPQLGVITKYLQSPDPKTREAAAQKVDAVYGLGFHRYLSGGL